MKRYLMIGAPVTSVRTPPLLRARLAERGVAAEIDAQHVEAEKLDGFMRRVAADRTVDGLLVTMPHKKTVIPHLDALSEIARAAGSVNAAKRLPSGSFAGAQFDGTALLRALAAKDVPFRTARILLAGLGGAGLAIAQALVRGGCRHLSVADADPALQERVLAGLRAMGGEVSAGEEAVGARDLLINATPLGMRPDDPSPFPLAVVEKARFVADIVADPPRTRLAEIARALGVPVITGRDMVHGQIEPIADWLLGADIGQ